MAVSSEPGSGVLAGSVHQATTQGQETASSFLSVSLGISGSCFRGQALVLLTDLVELLHVLEEVRAALQSDEELGLLAVSVTSWALDGDGLGSDLLEGGVVVSAAQWSLNTTELVLT